MSTTIVVRDGDLVTQDPSDSAVYAFDWDTDHLADGVTIATSKFKLETVVGTALEISVASITRSGTTATATTASAHGYVTGDSVTIAGAAQAAYNGTFSITVLTPTTFSYTVSGSPATPATISPEFTGLTASAGFDNVSILSAAPYSSRYTQFRFTPRTPSREYEISNTITTDESPSQTKERAFRVSMQ